jgi:hypothetical protein
VKQAVITAIRLMQVTPDLGGTLSTDAATAAIISHLNP